MKLYHGSKNGNLSTIKKMQAKTGEGIEVPENEIKKGIYLTSRYEFALAIAIRPDGFTHIDDDNKAIEFEHPELFFPEKDVYIYEVDVSEEYIKELDNSQYVVEHLDEIKPVAKFTHKAGEIEKYYELINWNKELKQETNSEFKIK